LDADNEADADAPKRFRLVNTTGVPWNLSECATLLNVRIERELTLRGGLNAELEIWSITLVV
jgi:hypothetical protein